MILMVGGPGDGRLMELDDRAVTVTVPIPGRPGFVGFTYARRRVAGRYVLASEKDTEDDIIRLMNKHAIQRAIVFH
jgi:hypothetical protein